MADALFRATPDGYLVTFAETGIEFQIDRLRRERQELIGELAVSCGIVGSRAIDGVLSVGTFNVSSPRARQDRARLLAERSRTNGKIDWPGLLEEVCQRVLQAERKGTPAVVLRDVPKPAGDIDHDVAGLKFPQGQATMLFGDGGSMKSLLALYVAGVLAQRGVRTGLFDWELDDAQHRLRLEDLFGPEMPDVRYVRCERPLIYEIDRLRQITRAEGLQFTIFDSAGYACAGKPEDAEVALSYFRCVRQLGTGSLHVAHITKGDGNDRKPFGSSFWHNSARSTWFVKLANTSPDGHVNTLGLMHRKANLGPLRAALAYEVTFSLDQTTIRRVDAGEVEELAADLPLWQRMKGELRGGPLTLARLAEDLGSNVATLDRTVRRKSSLFTKVSGDDGITRIALVARRVG